MRVIVGGRAKQFQRLVSDMNRSGSPTHGDQKETAHNGHFEYACYWAVETTRRAGSLTQTLESRRLNQYHGWSVVRTYAIWEMSPHTMSQISYCPHPAANRLAKLE